MATDLNQHTGFKFAGSGSGLPYGSCYGNEIAWTQSSAVQNTWYPISDADMADGQLNNVTHDGNGKLTLSVAGRYLINVNIAVYTNTTNKHIQIAVRKNTTIQAPLNHFIVTTANQVRSVGLTMILDIAASDTIDAAIRTTDAGGPNLIVDHLMITAVQIGG